MTDMTRQFSFVIEHDAPVIANAHLLTKLVVDMETGQRGFVITGKHEFLRPYTHAIPQFMRLLEAERELVSDDPQQLRALERIEKLVTDWHTKAAQPEIALR